MTLNLIVKANGDTAAQDALDSLHTIVARRLERERVAMIKDQVIARNGNTASPAFLNHIWQ